MSNLKYMYKINVGNFDFIKLFDTEQDAIDYSYRAIEPHGLVVCGGQLASSRCDDTLRDVRSELMTKVGDKWNNVELWYRWNPSTSRPGPEKYVVDEFTKTDLSNPRNLRSHFTQRITVGFKVKIEVMLKYDVEVDEVKIPGVPYQPAKVEQRETKWFEVYEMFENMCTRTCLSINPEEREMYQGDFRVRRSSREYFHSICSKSIELLIVEQD